ncbi:MAG: hypothetical protein Q7R57_04120 [Dehalococcoidales bacterium]|nr:hypothetical protein [Dehalococcoidales bacterium]
MGRITILEPVAEAKKPAAPVASRVVPLKTLSGKKIIFVSNEGWTCMPAMWEKLGQLLKEKHGVADVSKVPVPMQKASPPALLDDVASRADGAIVGLGI